MRLFLLLILCVTTNLFANRIVYSPLLRATGANYSNPGSSTAWGGCNYEVRVQNLQNKAQTVKVEFVYGGISATFQTGGVNYGANFMFPQFIAALADKGVKTLPLGPGPSGVAGFAWSVYVPYQIPVATAPQETPSGAQNLNLALGNAFGSATFKVTVSENEGAINGIACVECALTNLQTPQQVPNCATLAGGHAF